MSTAFWFKYPDADKVIYGNMLKTLSAVEISDEVGQGIIRDVKLRQEALKLSEMAYKLGQGHITVDELESYYQENFKKVDHQVDLPLEEVSTNLEDIVANVHAETGVRWRLDCLNKSIGSLRRGDFGFIFARPETGKTTFLASETTRFLEQGARVVWFNNEEQGYKVMLRVYQAFFGIELDKLLSNPKRFRAEFQERTGDNLRLYDAATIHRRDVETIINQIKPDVVIYDQLTKVQGFNADRNDLELGAKFQWARELAKGNHASIGVSQADGTAEGVRYLTMEHVANAKTAVQAEADFILGIGKTNDQNMEYARFLSISKNKLLGDADSIPELRHGRFEVMIEPQIARYRDIIKFD